VRRFWPLGLILLTVWADLLLWQSGDAGPVGWFLSRSIPQVFLLPPLVVLIWAVVKRRWLVTGAAGLVATLQIIGPMGLCFGAPGMGPSDLRVLSYNVEGFATTKEKPLAQWIGKLDADVLCLQEANVHHFKAPLDFEKQLPGYHILDRGGMVLASKWPFVKTDVTLFPSHLIPFHWNVQEASIKVKGQIVRVINVHLVPDAWQPPEWPALPFAANIERKRRIRDEEIGEVLRRVHADAGPVIVCGDFNQHAFGPRYRRLAKDLTDTFRATQTGFGYTLTSDYPTKRVDYVWTRGFEPIVTRPLSTNKSDHHPLLAEMRLR